MSGVSLLFRAMSLCLSLFKDILYKYMGLISLSRSLGVNGWGVC